MKDQKEIDSAVLASDNTLDKLTEKINITVLPSDPNIVVSNQVDLNSVTTALNSLTAEVKNQQKQLESIAQPNVADWTMVGSTFISLFVAVLALRYSVKESKQRSRESKKIESLNRRKAQADKEAAELAIERQRLSVQPYIILQTNHSIKEGVFEAFLVNKGVGPAIFKEFSLYVGKQKVTADNPFHAAIRSLLSKDHDYDVNAIFGIEAMAVSPSESIMLYQVKLHRVDSDLTNSYAVHKELTSFAYGVVYESLYGERKEEGFAGW
ncbi:hypothetical protein [Vibrio vulnificus]|uniref:hypothetical protein n=1 Tax=Vibrio vulnificus TaxID=672 RepID=UPI0019D46091|nr:hypothetical protein [Vibrio vulnificus]MBN8035238.1 hypothetical protein [Vibrio vulnificus]